MAILVYDINQVAWLQLNGVKGDMVAYQRRIMWEIPETPEVEELLRNLNSNPPVPIFDFIRTLKKLRGEMLELREEMNASGWKNERHG